jgi:ABC-type uncharacterized transport system substrate-binding protein
MWIVKRLWLGSLLIVLASLVLLFSDVNRRPAQGATARVAMLRYSSSIHYEESVRGALAALTANGFQRGSTLELTEYNAESDIGTANAIASEMVGGGFQLLITFGTPSLQAVANANREGRFPHVFGTVAAPARSGVGIGAGPLDHPPHLVGIGSMIQVDGAFEAARRMFPGLERVGMPWNAAEANSVAFADALRELCKKMGLTLLEANVDSTAAVGEAVSSLVSRGAQMIWVSGDNTVLSAVGSVVASAKRGRIPVMTISLGNAEHGALFDYGPNFYEIGYATADMAARILKGADPRTIPIVEMTASGMHLNVTGLGDLKDPWTVPDDVRREALVVIDENGRHERPRAKAVPAVPRPHGGPWQVDIIEYNNVLDVEEARAGVLDGLKESGLVDGRDYRTRIRNAQGDMPTVSGLVDTALVEGADLLITLSTPTLQAAIRRTQTVPIVFTYLASAVAAGAGRSDTDHLPNVTGVYMAANYDGMMEVVRETLPSARRLGTLYVPAEANQVFHRDRMLEATEKAGYEYLSVPANTAAEVPDAAVSLTSMRIEAVVQLPGNLTAAAFPSLAEAARRARIPVFVFQTSQIRQGAIVAVARDYHDGGVQSAMMAARVMRGESPATIPFERVMGTKLVVNIAAAKAIGVTLPPSLVARATERIGQ